MNATAQIAFANSLDGLIQEQPVELRRRLIAAMSLYDNECAGSRDHAIEAIVAGRPVYWRSTGYSAQTIATVVDDLNKGVPFAMAWNAAYRPDQRAFRDRALDYIVPISRGAAVDLARAYGTLNTFRDDAELELRRTRRAPR